MRVAPPLGLQERYEVRDQASSKVNKDEVYLLCPLFGMRGFEALNGILKAERNTEKRMVRAYVRRIGRHRRSKRVIHSGIFIPTTIP